MSILGDKQNLDDINLCDEGDSDYDDTPEQGLEKKFIDAFKKAKIPVSGLKDLIGRIVIVSTADSLFSTKITGVEIRNNMAYAIGLSLQQIAKREELFELLIQEYPLAYLNSTPICQATIQLL